MQIVYGGWLGEAENHGTLRIRRVGAVAVAVVRTYIAIYRISIADHPEHSHAFLPRGGQVRYNNACVWFPALAPDYAILQPCAWVRSAPWRAAAISLSILGLPACPCSSDSPCLSRALKPRDAATRVYSSRSSILVQFSAGDREGPIRNRIASHRIAFAGTRKSQKKRPNQINPQRAAASSFSRPDDPRRAPCPHCCSHR